MNWFVALPVRAGGWFDGLPALPPGLRGFHRDDLHFTVAFFGGVTEAQARAGWAAARWEGARDVTLGDVVPMGDPGRYSALSALASEGRAQLEAEIGACRALAMPAAGARPDRWPPKAHLTLARPTRAASDEQRAAGLRWAASVEVTGVAVRLDRIALYTWAEDRAARLFRIVEERAL